MLVGYAELDPEVGYVQGMNFVAATLVYHAMNPEKALKMMAYIMKKCGYRKLFLGDLSLGRTIANEFYSDLRRLVYNLYEHLYSEGM